MKSMFRFSAIITLTVLFGFVFVACDTPTNPPVSTVIHIAAIQGITAPATGGYPATTIVETAQYTGTVTWSPNHPTFAAVTQYTATISLTAKEGYTLQGVAENFFAVPGANSVTNAANSGSITAIFPATNPSASTVVSISAIQGISTPVTGETPATGIVETAQYTGNVAWSPNHSTFAAATQYTATISLTAKEGYTLQGVAENFFAVPGANSVTNAANSGSITAVFPAIVITGEQLQGTWTHTDGASTDPVLTFNADNTFSSTALGYTIGGTYAIDGASITLTFSTGTINATIVGSNTFKLNHTDGRVITYIKN
jgi:hypothetical protein